ncbi:hypothetical protein BN135_1966 [Cronobacter muytjensii 530]|uniref:Uncharacterized protein n=1 Tax=Cronobacter condimenti 1330 TaxID=1073999 RepID=K8AEB5_9ENTR|nr:hypothetical protein BN137_3507 [Cronobacter condimenti 1330]
MTDIYVLNRSGAHDHMLMIAKSRNLDHLFPGAPDDNY